MANYVILDTSIYRELGLKFFDHIDYKNLCDFTLNTDGEVLLSLIVMEEFTDYYKSFIESKTNAYLKATKDLLRDPYFKLPNNITVEITSEYEKAVDLFRDTLKRDHKGVPLSTLQTTSIDGLKLTQFILNNRKAKEENIQVRDYLIWDSVLAFAYRESEDRTEEFLGRKVTFEKSIITFITRDKGFNKVEEFNALLSTYNIDNVEIISSISEFLERKGFYFNFITEDLIREKIKYKRILSDLNKDIGALLSYVSDRYYENCYEKDVIESVIKKVEVLEYYTYIGSKDNKHKFTAQLKVWVRVVFEKDEYGYLQSLNIQRKKRNHLETYDELKRPFFDKPLLFIYGGLVNFEKKTIRSVKFLDYLPFVYLNED